jgi:hypothetical protein
MTQEAIAPATANVPSSPASTAWLNDDLFAA